MQLQGLLKKMPSQNGEDLVLWNFFDRKREGTFVEIGAYDGIGFSNTYFFEAIGWKGILVEPHPDKYKQCLKNRPFSKTIHAAITDDKQKKSMPLFIVENFETISYTAEHPNHLKRVKSTGANVRKEYVPAFTMDQILDKYEKNIDFISIDVEGAELQVLKCLNIEKYSPRVFVVEDNSYGQQKLAKKLLAKHGYIERWRVEGNIFFTKEDDPGEFRF